MNPEHKDQRKQGPRVSPPGRSNRVVPAAEPRASPMQGPAAPHQLKEPKPIGSEVPEKSRRLSPAVATEGVPGSQQGEPCRPGATQVRGSGEPEPDKSSGSKPVASSDPVPKPPGPLQSSRPRPTVPGCPGSVGSSRLRPVGSGDPMLRGPGAPRPANSGVSQPSAQSPNPGGPAGKPLVPPPSSGGSQPARGAQTVPEAKPPGTQPDRALPSSAGSAGTGSGNLQPQRAAGESKDPNNEDFRLHIVTWNVGSAVPPDDVTSLLGLNVGDGKIDMYIIGLQEVNSMINKRLKDAIFTDQWSDLCMDTLSPFGYVLVTSQRMQGIFLLVFAKYYHLPFLRGVQTESTRTGLGGYWGNKGGVSARMAIFGHMVCFLNCHLPAHMENSEQRMEDFESILQQQQFEGQSANGVLDHDVVFWFGDLNFRIEELDMHFVKLSIDGNKLSTLWEKDQLNMAKESETVLEGFHEGPLKFPPTYKFDVGTNTYDTSAKKRKPAWTDRILWKIKPFEPVVPSRTPPSKRSSVAQLTSGVTVTQYSYRSHMEYLTSDHKPVSAIFTLRFPYKVDLPLVQFFVEDEWTKVSDAVVKFRMAASFPRSSWDWIGLYKVGFRHHKDYVGYVWAKQEDSDSVKQQCQVAFGEEALPKGSGEYILGYYSNNMSTIVGVTEPFQIMLPSSLPSSSPSDSSDYSSEDDSTLVLLRPKSRSPSPGKAKQRGQRSRSRSPALPKLQALNLRPHSRETGKDRSPSPRIGHRGKRERLVCEPDECPSSSAPHPHTCASPGTPGIEVSAPEALGDKGTIREKKPQENALSGGKASGECKAAGL
ncbi:inositol polyphosphate 5-phosphatase K-like [Polyodon spathula]|uniref:inositol polyphosphate 5-phosphatase K-like n=1 Tax=Polyodon spathula TaxID=7913 RepID=UPI001B7E1CEA|nr:inositol polyphosphate 5-phosphatase K-like [Polyodon spathula]XP_041083385.1 inositol polyphosphate 5-phosphatase K-like [Polyodon spathula]